LIQRLGEAAAKRARRPPGCDEDGGSGKI